MAVTIDGTTGVSAVQTGAVESGDLPAGSVIQVVSATKTDSATVGGNNEIPNFSVTITPQSSNSKILVMYSLSFSASDQGDDPRRGGTTLLRNGQNIGNEYSAGKFNISTGDEMENISFSLFDTPSTTSAITYSLFHKANSNSMLLFINRTNSSSTAIGVSSITAMEIAG